MLKIVYPICCGMDVHKSFVYACIASTNKQGVTTYKSKRFSTFTKDLRLCAEWLAKNNCKDVCMESTGKYWIPIYNILEHTCNVVLAHPKYVKAIKGKKTDKKDAKWIVDIFKHDLVSGSFIPPADISQLRDLVRYRWKLTNFTVGEKNRAQNCLTVSNIKLDDVSPMCLVRLPPISSLKCLENPSEKITNVADFRIKGMKATNDEVLAAADGFSPDFHLHIAAAVENWHKALFRFWRLPKTATGSVENVFGKKFLRFLLSANRCREKRRRTVAIGFFRRPPPR